MVRKVLAWWQVLCVGKHVMLAVMMSSQQKNLCLE
jgi:hypothetical protein